MLPGVVPVELILGRSVSTVVILTGMRAFLTGVDMRLGVRVRGPVPRRDLHAELFDAPDTDDGDADWHAGRLKWGFELADGRRITNVLATELRPTGPQVGAGPARAHRPGRWGRRHEIGRPGLLAMATATGRPATRGVPVARAKHRDDNSGTGYSTLHGGRRSRPAGLAAELAEPDGQATNALTWLPPRRVGKQALGTRSGTSASPVSAMKSRLDDAGQRR